MRVVIVGAGQAGAALAAKLRSLGHKGPITLIGEEPAPPYQRPPLSKAYLLGEMEEERLWLRSAEFYADNAIALQLGQPVTGIDRAAQTVTVGGAAIPYDHLALTTGSTPRRLPAAIGGDLAGVFTVRSLADVDAMRAEFQPGRRVIIVGGGYIGLEAAAVAAKLGLHATVLEMAPRILPAAIGGDLAGVFTVRSLADVDAMRAEFQPGRRVIIVGGGYIGLEAAAVAAKLGLHATVLEMAPRILQRVAAPETSAFVAALHRAHGVEILESTGLDRLLGDARVSGVRLQDGRELPADFVICGDRKSVV